MGKNTAGIRGRRSQYGAARQRMLAVAGVAGTALLMGGLTACTDEGDKPQRDTGSSESAASDDADDDKADTDDEAKDDTDDAEQADADGGAGGTFAIGETAVYDNIGLKVTISDPEVLEPQEEWDEFGGEGYTAYTFTVVLENTGDESYDGDMTVFQGRAGDDGVEAPQVFSFEQLGNGSMGSVLPGKKSTSKIAFDVPDDADSLTVEFTELSDWDSESAFWTHEF
ncbi:DUF4352 domain-containing protein [Streptomyces lonarensis]|uniref:DUF4352 domain-containing protein n=1 Tax=Streptomyces lonarensis TaxID=700599 RepID=A0A7X6HZX7_9ACTN|nr:DUF4352 domain-containing protein [Streptomyces lonarensis]NJQ06704.1 DUF4352 domain-containing protein [Streptomyces lonarensis]